MAGRERKAWMRNIPPWHLTARVMAALVLLDQAVSLTAIPSSQAIVIACIGAICAPLPRDAEK